MDRLEGVQDQSSEQAKETSEKEPETFTKEQVETRERQAKSDALSDINRYKAESEKAIKAAQAAGERINRMLKDQDERELEDARDAPDRLTLIRERQTRREAESKLSKVEQELEEEKSKTSEAQEVEAKSTKERNAREIATRLGVDVKTLIKFTDGSTEAMEDLAKSLPKLGEVTTLLPDSSKTTGGTKIYKQDEILSTLDPKTMTPKQIHEQVLELEKASKEGRIK